MSEPKIQTSGGRWLMLNRVVAGLVSLVLLALLVATFFGESNGEDVFEVRFFLGATGVLGIVYAWQGRLPGWALELGNRNLTRVEDRSDLSQLVAVVILIGLVLAAVLLLVFT